MAMTYDYITIQASHTGLTPVIEAKQGDSGRGVIVSIPDIDLTGKLAEVYIQKNDGTEVFDNCSINSQGQVVVALTPQMLAVIGDSAMELRILQGGELVSSFDIILRVYKSLIRGSHISSSDEYGVLEDLISRAEAILGGTGAGAHNSIYRGKNLGNAVTAEQYAAIDAGTFDNLYIGDYWVIDDVNWRIAAFDYYYKTGDTECTTHHVTIVPDTILGTAKMNDTNTTNGGYLGTKMYTEDLNISKAKIRNSFGTSHILNHRAYLVNAVSSGEPSTRIWVDSEIELMTEQNVYGGRISSKAGGDVDSEQYPLFVFNLSLISNRKNYWLRNVATASAFSAVTAQRQGGYFAASNNIGVRPKFSIKA